MAKILVIHGAGMNMRGKVMVDVFGPLSLAEYDEKIQAYAAELGVEVEILATRFPSVAVPGSRVDE